MKKLLIGLALVLSPAAVVAGQEAYKAASVTAQEPLILVRGQVDLKDGKAEVSLPAWFEDQAKSGARSVFLSCRGASSALTATAVENGKFTITTDDNGDDDQCVCWLVVADRK